MVLAQVAAVGVVAPMTSASAFAGSAITRNMENLDRGVVATKTDDGVLISWRRLATEPADTTFTLYRNQEKINEGAVTNFVDASGTVNDKYTVVANGEMSDSVGVWENGYLDIPLAKAPESDVLQMDRNGIYYGSYTPGDSSYGDLDGDGQYEIVMLWTLQTLRTPLQAAEPVRFIWMLTNLTVLSFGELTWVTISVQDNTILSLT